MKKKLITALLVVAMALPSCPVFADELLDRIVALEQQVAELQAEVDALKGESVSTEETESPEQTKETSKKEEKADNEPVYEDEYMKVYPNGIQKDGSRIGPGIIIENISDVSLEIMQNEVSVDGFMVEATMMEDVSAGKKGKFVLKLRDESITEDDIKDVEIRLTVLIDGSIVNSYKTDLFTLME